MTTPLTKLNPRCARCSTPLLWDTCRACFGATRRYRDGVIEGEMCGACDGVGSKRRCPTCG